MCIVTAADHLQSELFKAAQVVALLVAEKVHNVSDKPMLRCDSCQQLFHGGR